MQRRFFHCGGWWRFTGVDQKFLQFTVQGSRGVHVGDGKWVKKVLFRESGGGGGGERGGSVNPSPAHPLYLSFALTIRMKCKVQNNWVRERGSGKMMGKKGGK